MADEEIAFSTSAFDVVGSWLLGGESGASASHAEQTKDRSTSLKKTSVTLYRPSAKTATLTGSQANGGGANGKLLTEKEKGMTKKLLRKPGSYNRKQTEEPEVEDTTALDKEEEDLLRARRGESSEAKANGSAAAETSQSEAVAASMASAANKKRKVSTQDELLEKLREEAARRKAKNLKTKQRLQRKKEEMRKQQAQSN